MKKQRALPFGYTMQGGRTEANKAEARIVRRVYKLYENGGSLDSISDLLTKQPVPYFDANPEWNKHKVKRILENERYTGLGGLPSDTGSGYLPAGAGTARQEDASLAGAVREP